MRTPIEGFEIARINTTLHGRSVYRPQDVPGHNVFKGYSKPGTGDALDVFASAGTPVLPVAAGLTITRWQNDMTKKEVVYLEGQAEGLDIVAVYAHINFNESTLSVGKTVPYLDQPVGWVRGDLSDPHLHFELWIDGHSINGRTPEILRDEMFRWLSGKAQAPWYAGSVDWAKKLGITDGSNMDQAPNKGTICAMFERYHASQHPEG